MITFIVYDFLGNVIYRGKDEEIAAEVFDALGSRFIVEKI